ncbi:MAG: hypothetical protein DI538_06180 [Azospira oryzae]|nr:MAG: hypothetical protein DI538_06180 [Azospira oryzae]
MPPSYQKPAAMCILIDQETILNEESNASLAVLAGAMVNANIGLICLGNGGRLITQIAAAIRSLNGHITCITTVSQPVNRDLLRLADAVVTSGDFHDCKMEIFRRSSSLLVIPGGLVIFDILMEYLTWMQRVFYKKPVFIVESGTSWKSFSAILDRMEQEQFMPANFKDRYTLVASLAEAAFYIKSKAASL